MRPLTLVAVAAWALSTAAPTFAKVTTTFSVPFPGAQGTLRVESDAGDEIVLTCSNGEVAVNRQPPETGPVACSRATRIDVRGSAGNDTIVFSGLVPAQSFGVFRGIAAFATIDAGAGDDVVVGPTSGFVRFDGGAGDDVLEGRSLDRYRFGPATRPELDSIVEETHSECNPSFFDSNLPGLTYWTVPWDALDFADLPTADPVTVDADAPGGILALHRNRTIRMARRGGVSIEAVAGGSGSDVLAGFCMSVGGGGDDRLVGVGEGDLLLGGAGNDVLDGRDGPDTLNGGEGDDVLRGDAGADALAGMSGNDASEGGTGGDVYLFVATGGHETERVTERPGTGIDVLSFDFPAAAPIAVDLGASGEVVATAPGLTVRTAAGTPMRLEGVIGGAGDDRLLGNAAPNHFWSGGGADFVRGGRGNDTYHVDWLASMPYGAYGYFEEPWSAPFGRDPHPRRPTYDAPRAPASVLRVAEERGGGADTLDLAEAWISGKGSGSRLEGQLRGARVDLSAPRSLMRAGRIQVASARRGGGVHIERVRGSAYRDVLIGNSANNVLEGRHERDLLVGRGGNDICLTYLRDDVLRGCERVRPRDPDR